MGALQNIEKPYVFLLFLRWGVPGGSLEVPDGSLEDPWGSLGVLGTSLGGSEWSLGIDVSATDHFVMHTKGKYYGSVVPLGLRLSLMKLRRPLYQVVWAPLQIL